VSRRILCFSAYGIANLRATALIECLRQQGYETIVPPVWGKPGTVAQLVLSVVPYLWAALTTRANAAVGFKPHPNVTLPLLVCRWRGLRTWIDVDDLDHGYRQGFLSKVIEHYERPFPRLFDLASYHNPKLESHLLNHFRCQPARLLHMPQGVNCDLFDAAPEHQPKLALDGKRVAVYTAHLDLACDLLPILAAWRSVVDQMPKACLLVVGGGPRQAEFQAAVARLGLAEHVIFSGPATHAEVRGYVALAELALLYYSARPVNECRCSLKLREYFAAGLKTVCNDVGELANFAHLTYQTPTDPTAFSQMIVCVFREGGDGREQRAKTFAREHLHWPRLFAAVSDELGRRLCYLAPHQLMSNSRVRRQSVLDYRRQRVRTRTLPPLLHVELTNACNLECPMCPRNEMKRKVGFMPVPLATKIAAEAAGQSEFVTLHAWGESILHPQFDQIVAGFRQRGIQTMLSTNGNLLNDQRADRLLDSGLDFLVFSLDAVTEETYNQVRVGGDFKDTVQKIEAFLAKAKARRCRTFCVCQLIYMSVNKAEALAFKAKWQALGAHVWLKPFSVWNGEADDIREFHPDQAKLRPWANLCDWPWRQMVIHWNGNVVPCCNDYDGAVVFGNVEKQTLAEVWNGQPMVVFRDAHVKGRATIEFCRKCPYASLGTLKQAVFMGVSYLTSLKLQTRYENYFKKEL